MAFKKLNQFTFFDFGKFSEGKTYKATGTAPWKDFQTGKVLGTKVTVVIAADKTHYELKEGEVVNNLYEKLDFKIPMSKTVPVGATVIPVNPVATVYGDHRNQLSIKADDVKVINPQATQPGGVK